MTKSNFVAEVTFDVYRIIWSLLKIEQLGIIKKLGKTTKNYVLTLFHFSNFSPVQTQ